MQNSGWQACSAIGMVRNFCTLNVDKIVRNGSRIVKDR